MKEQVFISAVLYLHNNEKSVINTYRSISNLLERKFEQYEIIIVNDASSDSTLTLLRSLLNSSACTNVTIINLSKKHGLETAILVGVDFSIGDFVIEIDSSEMSFDFENLYKLYKTACTGFDIVSLKLNKNTNWTSTLFYQLLNRFSETNIEKETELCFLVSRRAINAISTIKDKIIYRKVIHNFSGFNKTSISIDISNKFSKSLSFSEKIKMATDILFSFSDIGYKLNLYISLFFLVVSTLLGVYTIYNYLFNENLVTGWTTTMLFMSVGFSGIFIVFSIINKYLSLIIKEIRTLPSYVIQSIEKY